MKDDKAWVKQKVETAEQDFLARNLPSRMWGGMKRYLEYGIEPGDFLMGVLESHLLRCVQHADDENQMLLVEYTKFLYNCVPGNCWGSVERVSDWISLGGWQGDIK